jgi:hypothetical protein
VGVSRYLYRLNPTMDNVQNCESIYIFSLPQLHLKGSSEGWLRAVCNQLGMCSHLPPMCQASAHRYEAGEVNRQTGFDAKRGNARLLQRNRSWPILTELRAVTGN